MTALVSGAGAALPSTVVENDAFEALGVTDEWIFSRTGVRQRYRLQPGERLADLAAAAAAAALSDAGADAAGVDFVITATSTPDRISPGLAPEIAHLLGAPRAGAVDLNGACTGFLYALDYALTRVEHGSADRILVIGADAMSRITDESDRNTAVLFGDAAGAVVVEAASGATCIECPQYLSFGSAGAYGEALHVDRKAGVVRMDGSEVYAFAVDAMASEIEAVLLACQVDQDDVDLLVCHQANRRILDAVARRLRWRPERAVCYVEQFGNTSSASVPVALWKAQADGRLKPGHRVGLGAFGAGFTWGAGLINWKGCGHGIGSRPLSADALTIATEPHAGS
jgi:3-oxoacyl-[acyl-carrier-protein] synthase-3